MLTDSKVRGDFVYKQSEYFYISSYEWNKSHKYKFYIIECLFVISGCNF